MDREAPTFEEFSNAVFEDFMRHPDPRYEKEMIDYFYSEEAQEIIKDQYELSLHRYKSGEATYDQFMLGGVSAAASCLDLCF